MTPEERLAKVQASRDALVDERDELRKQLQQRDKTIEAMVHSNKVAGAAFRRIREYITKENKADDPYLLRVDGFARDAQDACARARPDSIVVEDDGYPRGRLRALQHVQRMVVFAREVESRGGTLYGHDRQVEMAEEWVERTRKALKGGAPG